MKRLMMVAAMFTMGMQIALAGGRAPSAPDAAQQGPAAMTEASAADDTLPLGRSRYKASGTHECSNGYTCDVEGENYRDCGEARAALERKDCCVSKHDSESRDFGSFACTPQ